MTLLLLCTDLDRTLLPNGTAPESPEARPAFARLAARSEVRIAYVTGRSLALAEQGMRQYGVPAPDYLIADVGATIATLSRGSWRSWETWERHLAADWCAKTPAELHRLLADLTDLRLQEPDRQTPFKLSYYVNLAAGRETLLAAIRGRFAPAGILANLVWSVDEAAGTALLDILPARAAKRQAIEFLLQFGDRRPAITVFAGDSGNDLAVLTSPLPSVLVANASDEVKQEARQAVRVLGLEHTLYVAQGGFLGMNGNYAAGVLEGAAHYLPAIIPWLEGKA